jgi:hypothetical protein
MKKYYNLMLVWPKTCLVIVAFLCISVLSKATEKKLSKINITPTNEVKVELHDYIYDSVIYQEGWDVLPQTMFWKRVMAMTPDSAIFNIASTRKMLETISVEFWDDLSISEQKEYRKSIRELYEVPSDMRIYVTSGKRDFYKFEKTITKIPTSIKVFEYYCVDPWYAQAILLIESPGKMNAKSITGANGPFQLMRSVARMQGLVVNSSIDERTDINKAAKGAAKLIRTICIPKVQAMLNAKHITYNETDLWFRLLVLHTYHAGAGNVAGVLRKINPSKGGMELIQTVWKTTYKGFRNSSQNYSQVALAAFCSFHDMLSNDSFKN